MKRIPTLALSLIAALSLITTSGVYAQGLIDGFMRGKGNTTVALSYTTESGSDFFAGSIKVTSRPFGELQTDSASLFVAHGLSDNLDVVASVPWIEASADGVGAPPSDSGLQDLSLYLKWRPWKAQTGHGEVSLIGALGYQAPLSDYVVESPIAIGHDSNNVDGRLLLHYVIQNRFFVDVGGGYISKDSDVPDAAYGSVKIGYFKDRIYLDAWFEVQDSEDGNNIGEGPFRSTEVDYERVGGTAYFSIRNGFGIAFGATRILDGKNIKDFTTFSSSLVFDF